MSCRLAKTSPLLILKTLVTVITAVAWATAAAELTQPATIDKASVTGIVFVIAPDHLDQFGSNLPVQQLVEQVSRNLAEWQYPIKATAAEPVSHRLEASIGIIKKDTTPVGFSFSSGNSDPRSADFQKAQVMPISCRLTNLKLPNQQAEYKTTVSADGLLPDNGHAFNAAKTAAKLSDEISTTCFNLLDELALQPHPSLSETQPSKPGWIPNISIEVKNKAAAKQPAATAEPKKDTAVSQPANDDPRKQVVIHNQGTPVILEFGYQRR